MLDANSSREFAEESIMVQSQYLLDVARREAVLAALIERCAARGWNLMAAHIRKNHVHVVVGSDQAPEGVMNDLKSYASRILNQSGLDKPGRKRWARHGSTRWLRNQKSVAAAIKYVVEKQGAPLAVFVARER